MPNRITKYHKLKNTVIMNEKQTKALILYCDMTFGHENVSVVECLEHLDKNARDLGLTRMQYLDYVVANGKLPE